MDLSILDYSLTLVSFTVVLGIVDYLSKKSGKSNSEYHLGYIGENHLDRSYLQATVSTAERFRWQQLKLKDMNGFLTDFFKKINVEELLK